LIQIAERLLSSKRRNHSFDCTTTCSCGIASHDVVKEYTLVPAGKLRFTPMAMLPFCGYNMAASRSPALAQTSVFSNEYSNK
jgi:hypothetical protein